jgi:L-lactate dehydrogenase complex protein LldG
MKSRVTADQRAQVFARIREALRVSAPHRHVGHIGDHPAVPDDRLAAVPDSDQFRAWLPAVGESLEEQLALFTRNSEQLKTELHRAASLEEAAHYLNDLAQKSGWQRIATHRHPLAFPVAERVPLPKLIVAPGYEVHEMERCDAAITGCDFLVAQTGSILVTEASAGGRALSVLPPHHVVVAKREQLVPDLAAALRGARARYAAQWPSFLSFITGPSRTGDIERILVLGAHGPKRLTVLLID